MGDDGRSEKQDHYRMPGPCRDCGVGPGEPHAPGCDIARCLYCGGQYISCDCDPDDPAVAATPRDVWTEEWPGGAEALEYGVDLVELATMFRWDRERRRWVRP